MYLAPTIVMLGGTEYRPAVPRHDMATQIIWLDGCFTVATTYYLSIRFPNGSLMCTWRGTNCCIALSFTQRVSNGDDVWQSPVSFSTSLVAGVALLCLPVRLQSKFFAETSRKSSGTYCGTF